MDGDEVAARLVAAQRALLGRSQRLGEPPRRSPGEPRHRGGRPGHPPQRRGQRSQQPSRCATPAAAAAGRLLGTMRLLHARCCGAVLAARGAPAGHWRTRRSSSVVVPILAVARPFSCCDRAALGLGTSVSGEHLHLHHHLHLLGTGTALQHGADRGRWLRLGPHLCWRDAARCSAERPVQRRHPRLCLRGVSGLQLQHGAARHNAEAAGRAGVAEQRVRVET